MTVFLVAGARPNFMKIAPLYREAANHPVDCRIVHTGQHYDYEMSQAFFEDLELPRPDFFLDAGSGSHAQQTARIMTKFEDLCQDNPPDLVLVVGDVNSTLACSIVAKKMGVEVAHVEAGLRSGDISMPEEVNRIVTDSISDYFFVTEKSGLENLLQEGKPEDRIFFVGHVMIDNLLHQLKKVEDGVENTEIRKMKEQVERYGFMTLHRPSNVDSKETLQDILGAIAEISRELPLFFPVHPRTRKMLDKFGLKLPENVVSLPPLRFQDALYLWKDAAVVLTDSGGLQEETTALGVPCITIRENTERPVTVEVGTNILAGCSRQGILDAYEKQMAGKRKRGIPEGWDGRAAARIWNHLLAR